MAQLQRLAHLLEQLGDRLQLEQGTFRCRRRRIGKRGVGRFPFRLGIGKRRGQLVDKTALRQRQKPLLCRFRRFRGSDCRIGILSPQH